MENRLTSLQTMTTEEYSKYLKGITESFTQEEWNALAIIHRLGKRLNYKFKFNNTDQIIIKTNWEGDVNYIHESQIFDNESGTLFTHDRDARIFAENNMVHNPDAKNCFCERCKDDTINQ